MAKTPEKSTKPQPPWAKNIRPLNDFDTEVQFLKYILNHCLTRLDTTNNQVTAHDALNETIPEHPVPQDEPATSTDTNLLQHKSAASNDQTSDDMEYIAASTNRGHDYSSDEDVNEKPIKKSASSSTTSVQTDTRVRKRGEEKIWPRSPPSLPPLDQGNRGPIEDLYLIFALQLLLRGVPPGEIITTKSPPPPHHHHQNPKKVI